MQFLDTKLIQVVLGFSITAYLTLAMLAVHYIAIHNYRRKTPKGKQYENPVDREILLFVRERLMTWRPSRRFEYAMEKAVLILSDTQLVTGLAFLIGAYSQLNCGISAYHWQIMVYVVWFSSFSFLSAMTFLEDYFQANQSLRTIRIFFMFVLASFLIVALLPTGSHNWLNLLPGGGGFYPSHSAKCYYVQLVTDRYDPEGGPKMWSMVVSIFVVGVSYVHSGVRLFDPTAALTRKYFRAWPGSYLKRFLYLLERKSAPRGLRAGLWTLPYLVVFAGFASLRAVYDILESMLFEILWLTFAIAWGTVKLWDTRRTVQYNREGKAVNANPAVLEEDFWSFGQTLPLVLLLVPILGMAQAYLDNDAKAAEAAHKAQLAEREAAEKLNFKVDGSAEAGLPPSVHGGLRDTTPDPRNSTSCSIRRCNHRPSICVVRTSSTATSLNSQVQLEAAQLDGGPPPGERPASPSSSVQAYSASKLPTLPQHPYPPFIGLPWCNDLYLLIICQSLMAGAFALFLLTQLSSFLGVSVFLRSRLYVGWILGVIPASILFFLLTWYVAGWLVNRMGKEGWLKGRKYVDPEWETGRWAFSMGLLTFWLLRIFLLCACLVVTFFVSLEIAGPQPLAYTWE
jgi:hypothetical protein